MRLDGSRPWDPRVVDERLFDRVLHDGTLGLGDAYVDGWWDCDRLDELVARALLGADLLVIGHSGHSAIWGKLLGTTADKIVDHAPCSVLVVR